MLTFQTDLGDASTWCDSACERCPLLSTCKVGQLVSQRINRMSEDDGPDVLVADLTRDLNRALVMLEEVCEEEGIDVATLEAPPVPEPVARVQALGTDLARAAMELTEAAVRSGRIDEATSARLVGNTTLVAVKSVRVGWSIADPLLPPGQGEAVEPILLLIERANAEVRRDARRLSPFVPALVAARFAAAHGALIDFVTPWIAGISAETRAELNARIAAGCAPSPFCRQGSEGGARA